MRYKATTYMDTFLKSIDKGHSETFDQEYQINVDNNFIFRELDGRFYVISVTVNLKEGLIDLLISPKI